MTTAMLLLGAVLLGLLIGVILPRPKGRGWPSHQRPRDQVDPDLHAGFRNMHGP
jgi:hypothetical protein